MDTPMANGSTNAEDPKGPYNTQPAVKFASPPKLERMMNAMSTNGNAGIHDEAAELLLNVSSGNDQVADTKMVIAADPVSPPRKDAPVVASYLHTPPDDPLPERDSQQPTVNLQQRGDASNSAMGFNNAPTPASDRTASPAQSTAGSTSKPRNKRKRNATAGPSRPPAYITPPAEVNGDSAPDHFLGMNNTQIRCICGFDFDDGFTIQCEHCGAWEHGLCFGYMDEESAPDRFFCELCVPRPTNSALARELQEQQIAANLAETQRDEAAAAAGGPGSARQGGRSKGKKSRSEAASRDDSKDPSPGVMKPPSQPKPKRRPTANKPRMGSRPTTTAPPVDATPTQPVFKEPTIPPLVANTGSNGHELDDDYFKIKPWLMEYTPVKANVVRGKGARRAMRRLYLDWADDDQDDQLRSGRKRSIDNPSGLPSPTDTGATRYSPEAILPPPDFSTLAPPVPPVTLFGGDLESQSAAVIVKVVRNTPSFLPLSYSEVSSTTGVYSHPSLYGVFADERLDPGSLIGECRGEVIDCETYRRDPINQYAGLGMPKPFVRSMGPPVDLMIDCRGYGTDLRYIRSSCHPNAVLRPIIWRSTHSDVPLLRFGIFATTDIHRKEEITLAWEWDDHHVVHALQSIIQASASSDGSVAQPDVLVRGTIRTLAQKFDTVLTTLYGAFSSCACRVQGKCALAQMKYIVDFSDSLEDRHKRHPINGKRSSAADLGELVGAIRGWRRRELELHGVQQDQLLNGHSTHLVKRDPEDLERARLASQSRGATEEASENQTVQDEEMEVDEDNGDRATDRVATEEAMDVDDDNEDDEAQAADAANTASPLRVPPISETFTPAHESKRITDRSSVTLTSPPTSVSALQDADLDDGHESDATTVTQPRSVFSDDEDVEVDVADERDVTPENGVKPALNVSSRKKLPAKSVKDRTRRDTPPSSVKARKDSDRPGRLVASAKPGKVHNGARKKARVSDGRTGQPPTKSAKATDESQKRATVPDQTVGPLAEPQETMDTSEPLDEIVVKEPEQVQSPREPTPPPPPKLPTPPPPRRITLAEYLKNRQAGQGIVPPMESPAVEAGPIGDVAAAAVSEPAVAENETTPQSKPEMDELIKASLPDERVSPVKPSPTEPAGPSAIAPVTPAASSVAVQPEVDLNGTLKPFNFSDYLPSKANAANAVTTPTIPVESPAASVATPGLGLTTRDYFPTQPSTPQVSSSYVPRKSSSYVPRSQSGPVPAESPSINDYIPPPPAPASTTPIQPTSSWAPRPSPRSETNPLPPPPPPHGQSASYMPRQSPYKPSSGLPEVKEEPRNVSIPPPATREAPPHAQPRAPPTGPKVPPTGPRTSGGAAGDPHPPPLSRDRDWGDSRDRWDRDRDRDWERERDRDRDRDRDPVSPRAVFSVGSARGGAPVPVPFHRGRGGGRGGFRGGPPRGGW